MHQSGKHTALQSQFCCQEGPSLTLTSLDQGWNEVSIDKVEWAIQQACVDAWLTYQGWTRRFQVVRCQGGEHHLRCGLMSQAEADQARPVIAGQGPRVLPRALAHGCKGNVETDRARLVVDGGLIG